MGCWCAYPESRRPSSVQRWRASTRLRAPQTEPGSSASWKKATGGRASSTSHASSRCRPEEARRPIKITAPPTPTRAAIWLRQRCRNLWHYPGVRVCMCVWACLCLYEIVHLTGERLWTKTALICWNETTSTFDMINSGFFLTPFLCFLAEHLLFPLCLNLFYLILGMYSDGMLLNERCGKSTD